MNATHDWELMAREDPFFAVLTDDRYHLDRLTPEAEESFWASGDAYIQHVTALLAQHLGVLSAPDRALDFGCGVGRLLLPLARLSRSAVGIDCSPTMREHAHAACRRAGLLNVEFAASPQPGDTFDLINSALVFQHIPVREGLSLLEGLLESVRLEGVVAIQFLSARPHVGLHRRISRWLRSRSRTANRAFNLLQRRPLSTPYMQMNSYPMTRVHELFERRGFRQRAVVTSEAHGFQSSFLLARRTAYARPEQKPPNPSLQRTRFARR